MKFGGVGLGDGAAVRRACTIVEAQVGAEPILVVSAHAGVTEELEACARAAAEGRLLLEPLRLRHKGLLRQLDLNPELLDKLLAELGHVLYSISGRRAVEPEELDFVLSFGERMSARIVAACLRSRGCIATPVDAFDLGLTTDSCHGSARPLSGVEASLRRSLADIPGVPVVTGFLAKDGSGKLTTLGRNGSDLTAALVARAAGAGRLVFWKSVPGIMTADPRLIPEARVIETLSLAEARALAFHGGEILHPLALEPVQGGDLVVEVRDVRRPDAAGSCLVDRATASGPAAITGSPLLYGIEVPHEEGELPGALFALLHAHRVRPRSLQVLPEGVVVHAPPSTGFEILERELGERARRLEDCCSVAVVGEVSSADCGELELLERAGLHPMRAELSAPGSCRLFLLSPGDYIDALRALHEGLLEGAAPRASATGGQWRARS